MTTIIAAKDCLATDSQETFGDICSMNAVKMYHLKGYGAVATTGDAAAADYIAQWFFTGASPHTRERIVGEWSALLVNTDGRIFLASHVENIYEQFETICLGSGGTYALGAYDATNNVRHAMKLTMDRNIYTGGRMSYYMVEEDVCFNAIEIEGEIYEFFRRRSDPRPENSYLESEPRGIEAP